MGLQDQLCTAHPVGESFKERSLDPDPDRRFVFCLDEPGLPMGPRHELRRGDRPKSRTDDAVKLRIGKQEDQMKNYVVYGVTAIVIVISTLCVVYLPINDELKT